MKSIPFFNWLVGELTQRDIHAAKASDMVRDAFLRDPWSKASIKQQILSWILSEVQA